MMKRVFQLVPLIAILLTAISLILGACVSPAPTTPTPVPTPTPTPVVFTTSDLTIVPARIRPGGTVTVGVTVTNTGEQPGTYTVALKVDGAIAETQDVTLAGGASQRVTFILISVSEGTHKVTIDQLTGRLEVEFDV